MRSSSCLLQMFLAGSSCCRRRFYTLCFPIQISHTDRSIFAGKDFSMHLRKKYLLCAYYATILLWDICQAFFLLGSIGTAATSHCVLKIFLFKKNWSHISKKFIASLALIWRFSFLFAENFSRTYHKNCAT